MAGGRAALRRALLSLLLLAPARDCRLTKVLLEDVDPQAVCVDGSPAGYFWEEAVETSSGPVFWLVYLQGGFWCWSEESCRDRCKGQPRMCSSTVWDDTVEQTGILSSEPGAAMRSAHKALVPTCTSDAHMGDASAFGLQFRGARVVQAVLKDLVSRGLGSKGKRHVLVFGGGSAGARGAMVHLDYVPAMLGPSGSRVEVIGFLDSPLWLDVQPLAQGVVSFREQTEQVYKHFNVRHLGPDCAAAFDESERWKCLFGQYRIPYVKSSYVLVASQYDSFQVGYNLNELGTYLYGAPHLNETEQTLALFLATRTRLLLGDLASPRHMLVSFSCWSHAVSGSHMFFTYRLDEGATLNDVMLTLLNHLPVPGSISHLRREVRWPMHSAFRWVDVCTGVSCGTGCTQGTPLAAATTTAAPATSAAASTALPTTSSPAAATSTAAPPPATATPTPAPTPAPLPAAPPPRRPYGAACERDADCRSGLCGASCTARNASCVCPAALSEDGECLGPSTAGGSGSCSACCATVAREDADEDGRVCVADALAKTAERHAFTAARRPSRELAATAQGHRSALPTVMEPAPNVVRVIGARRFGTACQAWSECASGVCGASCACDGELLGTRPCTCACASEDVLSEARVPTCCAFFVGAEPCADSCPPCTEQQCGRLPGDCRWGCTAGRAEGQCSARPEAFLNEECRECCNANFCKANASGLRGDWIEHNIDSGPWPGLDGKGDDLWTRDEVPCPMGHAWVSDACQVACELPPGIVVHRILDLGNGTWFQNVAFSDGAVIHAACEPGHQGSRDLWTLHCRAGTWKEIEDVDCGPVHCPIPADPVGIWEGRGEFNQTLRLRCAEGYAARGGAVELQCLRQGPWEVPVARCTPSPLDLAAAQAFRKGMQSAALMSVIGSVATLSLVMVLCWREPPQGRGRPRPRAEEPAAAVEAPAPATRQEHFVRAGLGRDGGLE